MKKKFCPRCGKEVEELVGGLCKECFKEGNAVCEIPKEIEVEVCKKCGRFKTGGGWVDRDFEKAIEEEVQEEVDIEKGVEDFGLEVEVLPEKQKCRVVGKGRIEGVKLKGKGEVDIRLSKSTCGRCSKISSGYYEAVVQIRGEDEKVEEALRISQEALQSSGDRKAFLSDWEEVKNGVDLFVGSKSVARKIVKEISSRYKTEKKSSKSLYGEKDGRKKYRSTYLVRILE